MKAEDLVIGQKYVPHQKTTYGPLENSSIWAKGKKQGYIYYTGQEEDGMFCFAETYRDFPDGDFFNPEDVTPYIETKTKKVMKTQSITRTNLKQIYDVACFGWQARINEYAYRNPFGNIIEFTNDEVAEMFKAASPEQLIVLKRHFKEVNKEIDLRDKSTFGGVKLFVERGSADECLIARRVGGDFADKGFYLNKNFNWEIKKDDHGFDVLIPTHKNK